MNVGNITDLNIAFAADSSSLDQSILINHYPITQDFFMAKFLEASNCIYLEAIVILMFAITSIKEFCRSALD